MDDEIEFVQALQMPGTIKDHKVGVYGSFIWKKEQIDHTLKIAWSVMYKWNWHMWSQSCHAVGQEMEWQSRSFCAANKNIFYYFKWRYLIKFILSNRICCYIDIKCAVCGYQHIVTDNVLVGPC